MVILFSIAQILCHNNLEKLGAWEDVDAALPKSEFGPFGQNGPNSVRISCFGPKKEKFHDLFLKMVRIWPENQALVRFE